jgi:hypothetical protein
MIQRLPKPNCPRCGRLKPGHYRRHHRRLGVAGAMLLCCCEKCVALDVTLSDVDANKCSGCISITSGQTDGGSDGTVDSLTVDGTYTGIQTSEATNYCTASEQVIPSPFTITTQFGSDGDCEDNPDTPKQQYDAEDGIIEVEYDPSNEKIVRVKGWARYGKSAGTFFIFDDGNASSDYFLGDTVPNQGRCVDASQQTFDSELANGGTATVAKA